VTNWFSDIQGGVVGSGRGGGGAGTGGDASGGGGLGGAGGMWVVLPCLVAWRRSLRPRNVAVYSICATVLGVFPKRVSRI
jgi:hypothetical protein